ncbi:DUF2630 family protein [Conexibacter sp. CPCC 206217]|uniref:DUF2630 family protein n=1 Tax=Conexibacter sp. CPCC 206217 TaxID=3064574 RepID=UPI00271DC9FB|nr:DUF2630 family protein [Conexibacter sp. CPCC 206217]MDO8210317.1 DUF2630 family protein [Conexibacter sp. CPCC 206217]
MPSDEQIQQKIDALEQERLRLREHEAGTDPTLAEDRTRVAEISVELDQLWDLLRRRRALRNVGRNPDEAQERPASVVERYLS